MSEEKKNGFEASFDLEDSALIGLLKGSEFEEISERFNQGKETLNDLLNNYRHLKMEFVDKNNQKIELEVVELKYYKKLIEEVKKQQKIINDMANEIYITAVKDNGTHFSTEQEIIDYFTNKVEEDK